MRYVAVMALLLVSAFWGGHSVIGKVVEAQIPPFALTVWRFTLAGVLYLPLLYRLLRARHWTAQKFWLVALTGLFWAVLYPLFYYQALTMINPVQSLLLINTAPLFVLLLSRVFLKERLAVMQVMGIIVAFLGVVWMTVGHFGHAASLPGILLTLVAALAFAGYTVTSRALSGVSLLDLLAASTLWGALDLWVLAFVTGRAGAVWGALGGLNAAGWAQLLYIVLIVSSLAYVLYLFGLRRLTTPVASALTFYPQVVFGSLMEWVWLGDRPTLAVLVSAVLILGGVVLMNLRRRRSVGGQNHDSHHNLLEK